MPETRDETQGNGSWKLPDEVKLKNYAFRYTGKLGDMSTEEDIARSLVCRKHVVPILGSISADIHCFTYTSQTPPHVWAVLISQERP